MATDVTSIILCTIPLSTQALEINSLTTPSSLQLQDLNQNISLEILDTNIEYIFEQIENIKDSINDITTSSSQTNFSIINSQIDDESNNTLEQASNLIKNYTSPILNWEDIISEEFIEFESQPIYDLIQLVHPEIDAMSISNDESIIAEEDYNVILDTSEILIEQDIIKESMPISINIHDKISNYLLITTCIFLVLAVIIIKLNPNPSKK